VLLGVKIEPFVANRPDVPCRTENGGLIDPTDLLGLTRLSVLSAQTFADPEGIPGTFSESEVLDLKLPIPGTTGPLGGLLPAIHAEALNTKAEVTCADHQPLFNSESKVVNLEIGGNVIAVPQNGEPFKIDLGIATIYVNERITTPTSVTRRALRISSPLLGLDVVVAETSANAEGNPCGSPPPPPQQQQPPPPCNTHDKYGDCYKPPKKKHPKCAKGYKKGHGHNGHGKKSPRCKKAKQGVKGHH